MRNPLYRGALLTLISATGLFADDPRHESELVFPAQ